MQYKDLVRDFANRTLENYKLYKGKYKVTELINSSLGLFVFPEQRFFNGITNNMVSVELLEDLINNSKSTYIEPKNLKNICRHIRNGITHFRLKFTANNINDITGVEISDELYDKEKNNYYDFKIVMSTALLEKFFLEFSASIIK